MVWGVSYAIERRRSVLDIIFDKGGVGKEPMIRILGKDPRDVVRKLRSVASKMDKG